MPVYEFECAKGHITADLVPVGTRSAVCQACVAEMKAMHAGYAHLSLPAWKPIAKRILSPTPTTFEFADNRSRR